MPTHRYTHHEKLFGKTYTKSMMKTPILWRNPNRCTTFLVNSRKKWLSSSPIVFFSRKMDQLKHYVNNTKKCLKKIENFPVFEMTFFHNYQQFSHLWRNYRHKINNQTGKVISFIKETDNWEMSTDVALFYVDYRISNKLKTSQKKKKKKTFIKPNFRAFSNLSCMKNSYYTLILAEIFQFH